MSAAKAAAMRLWLRPHDRLVCQLLGGVAIFVLSAGEMRLPVAFSLIVPAAVLSTQTVLAQPASQPASAPVAAPADGAAAPQDKRPFDLEVHSVTLQNGLEVLINVERTTPTLALCLTYPGGARNETRAQRGYAQLVGEMLARTGGVDARQKLRARGGVSALSVTADETALCEVLPKSELAFGIWLMSERLATPGVSARRLVGLERAARDSYRRQIEETPYARSGLRLRELAFQGYVPYERGGVGGAELLEGSDPARVNAFYRAHYGPKGAVLSVVGDVDPDAVGALAEAKLGALGTGLSAAPAFKPGTLPRQTSERFSSMDDDGATYPALSLGWAVPASDSAEHRALELAAVVLAHGESSRLHQKLVRMNGLAAKVEAETEGQAGPDLLALRITASTKSPLDKIQKVLDAELRQLQTGGPTRAELDKAVSQIKNDLLFSLDSRLTRAQILGRLKARGHEPKALGERIRAYAAITPADVRRAVSKHLADSRRVVVEVYPKGLRVYKSSLGGAPLRKFHIVKSGETLIGIAKAYGVSVAALTGLNRISTKAPIHPGQKLKIPRGGKAPAKPVVHVVKKGDSLIGIAKKHGVSVSDITSVNGISKKKPIYPGQKLTIPRK